MSEDTKKWAYGEYSITYDEHTDKFVVNLGEESELAFRPTLSAARQYCDGRDARLEKSDKKKFEPIEALVHRYGDIPELTTVTSVCDDGSVWLKKQDGSREKLNRYNVSYLKVKDEESLRKVSEIKALNAKIEELKTQKYDLAKTLKELKLVREPA